MFLLPLHVLESFLFAFTQKVHQIRQNKAMTSTLHNVVVYREDWRVYHVK